MMACFDPKRLATRLLCAAAMIIPSYCAAAGFDQHYELQGIRFHVECPNTSSLNPLTLSPTGLAIVNSPQAVEIDGTVTGAEVADLDGNGWPEIYIYINTAGSGAYGSVVAYAVNNGKSMSAIYLPPTSDNPELAPGYRGHDQFTIIGNALVQRFPVYAEEDTQSAPSGGTRQVSYELSAGEAGWQLRPKHVLDEKN